MPGFPDGSAVEGGEPLRTGESRPILLVQQHLQGDLKNGFEEVKKLAESEGWQVDVIHGGDVRNHNMAKFVARERKIKIWPDGHSEARTLWELGHEVAWGNVALRAKSETTREAGIEVAKAALLPLTELEFGLRDHTDDEELLEALGDKSIYKSRVEGSEKFAVSSATILYDHD